MTEEAESLDHLSMEQLKDEVTRLRQLCSHLYVGVTPYIAIDGEEPYSTTPVSEDSWDYLCDALLAASGGEPFEFELPWGE